MRWRLEGETRRLGPATPGSFKRPEGLGRSGHRPQVKGAHCPRAFYHQRGGPLPVGLGATYSARGHTTAHLACDAEAAASVELR